jgi:hypothetical protein
MASGNVGTDSRVAIAHACDIRDWTTLRNLERRGLATAGPRRF